MRRFLDGNSEAYRQVPMADFGRPPAAPAHELLIAAYGPNATACMMRPGRKVKRPAITSAPVKMLIIALRWLTTRWRRAWKTASGSITSVKIASKWIGLQGPHWRNSWIQNEVAATTIMSTTQIQPRVRCGSVPLGAA